MKARVRDGYAVDWQVRIWLNLVVAWCSIFNLQDLVSRFTLDSATEFLFGKDVRSLSSGLPYPPTSFLAGAHKAKPGSDEFASAFWQAQHAAAERGRYQGLWGLTEFWKDKVETQRDAIDKFINPIIADALRRKAEYNPDTIGEKPDEEDTLLSQLVKVTDGM